MHINPDHFLETDQGRVVTSERNKLAWQECYALLAHELNLQGSASRVVVLVGPQGAGKSTWARQHTLDHPNDIIFDAILVKRTERARIVEAVGHHGGKAIAVWFQTSLED